MPSKLPQLNVRVEQETIDRLSTIQAALAEERGRPVSQPDAVAWAILQAEKKIRKKKKETIDKS